MPAHMPPPFDIVAAEFSQLAAYAAATSAAMFDMFRYAADYRRATHESELFAVLSACSASAATDFRYAYALCAQERFRFDVFIVTRRTFFAACPPTLSR